MKSKKCNCICHEIIGIAKSYMVTGQTIFDSDIYKVGKECKINHEEKCCDKAKIEKKLNNGDSVIFINKL